ARPEEVPGALRNVATGHELRALLHADLDVVERRLPLPIADERTHLGRLLQRRTNADRVGPCREPGDELVVDRSLDQLTRSGAAVLARVVEDRPEGALDAHVEVGVSEHDVRGLAAELERDPGDVARGGLHHPRTDL